jgi:hypothetical protein
MCTRPPARRRFLRDNGLSVALFILFTFTLIGQALTGWHAHAEELRTHAQPPIDLLTYLTNGHFTSAVFENWECEFLQMAIVEFSFVVIKTKFIFIAPSSVRTTSLINSCGHCVGSLTV